MNTQIKISILSILTALLGACGHKTSTADAAATAVPLVPALSVTAASTTVAAGGSTVITVSGGSGSYVTATASYGTVVAAGASTFTYTAPATVTSVNELVTITDSNGLSGNAFITLSGGATTVTTTSCSGTYNANINGTTGTITLVGGSSGAVAGYLYMLSYYYPLYGSCVISGTTGTFSVNEPFFNSTYAGNITVSAGVINISGTASNSNTTTPASWTASSTTALSTVAAPTSSSCQGTYNATIGPNTGTIKITHDGNNKIAGMMTIQGYYYSISGTCSSSSVTFTNVTTGSAYTGTVAMSGTSTVNMSGSYTANSTTYSWSASK